MPGWHSQLSIQLLILAQIIISQLVGSSPVLGSVLTAQSLEPVSDFVFPSLSVHPLLALYLSLSLKNELKMSKKIST